MLDTQGFESRQTILAAALHIIQPFRKAHCHVTSQLIEPSPTHALGPVRQLPTQHLEHVATKKATTLPMCSLDGTQRHGSPLCHSPLCISTYTPFTSYYMYVFEQDLGSLISCHCLTTCCLNILARRRFSRRSTRLPLPVKRRATESVAHVPTKFTINYPPVH